MISGSLPLNEAERLNELYSYNILDSAPEQDFTDIVELASAICNTPISLITLLDSSRQWLKAKTGMDVSETERSVAFCSHTINGYEPLLVMDATNDERFADNPLVTGDPAIRFYGGFPLITASGHCLGSLCVIDNKPRDLDAFQIKALKVLSRQVINLMDERAQSLLLKEMSELEKKQNIALERLMDTQRRILSIMGHDTRAPLYAINRIASLAAEGKLDNKDMISSFGEIEIQLDAVLTMLEDLLHWGQAHLNAAANETRFSLRLLTEDILNLYKANADHKNLELINEVPARKMVKASVSVIGFILRNLISNAIKFTSEGSVSVNAIRKEDTVCLMVKDTGVGMTCAQVDAYIYGDALTTPGTHDEKGTGMGSVLIHEFLQQIGGTMEVNSSPGQGTTIMVTIPISTLLAEDNV